MTLAILLLSIGLLLSAFFSGSETGLYRASHVKLVLDARGGNWISRGLLVLANHPSLMVATVLVGNNGANYLVSLATVLAAQSMLGVGNRFAEIVVPVAMAPIIFVYGELLPKRLFFDAPNRLIRRFGVPLLACVWIFLPITAILYAFSKIIEWLAGESPQRVQLALARKELAQVLEEGHEVGILLPTQRALAHGLFAMAGQPVARIAIPAGRMARLRLGMSKSEMRRIARQARAAALPIEEPQSPHRALGYVRTIDLYLDADDAQPPIRPLVDIRDNEIHIAALTRLAGSAEVLARVINAQGLTVGFVQPRRLSEAMFRER